MQRRIEKGRLKREIAIGEAIGRLKERYPRVARYHTITYDATTGKLSHEPNAEKKAKAELLDGGYLLRTDRTDLSAREAWLMYMTLTRAENAFRMIKTRWRSGRSFITWSTEWTLIFSCVYSHITCWLRSRPHC